MPHGKRIIGVFAAAAVGIFLAGMIPLGGLPIVITGAIFTVAVDLLLDKFLMRGA